MQLSRYTECLETSAAEWQRPDHTVPHLSKILGMLFYMCTDVLDGELQHEVSGDELSIAHRPLLVLMGG